MKKAKISVLLCMLLLVFVMLPVTASAAKKDKITLTIVSNDSGLEDFGHAFLVITNNSSRSVQVGPYILLKNKQVVLGMRDSYKDHLSMTGGAYFNVEAVQPGVYKDFTYKTISVSANDVSKIGDYFQKNSYYETVGDLMFHNCTTFSVRAWNLVADEEDQLKENMVDEPWKLKEEIRKLEGAQSGTQLVGTVLTEKMTSDCVYYMDQDGNIIPYQLTPTAFLKLETLNCNQIKLTWKQAVDHRISGQDMVTGYIITYSASDGEEQALYIKKNTITQYTIKNLDAGKKYTFKIAPAFENHGYAVAGTYTKGNSKKTEKCKVILNHKKVTLDMAKTKKLTLTASSTGDHTKKMNKVKWSSGNKTVATVNSKGVVTGKNNGTTTIKATIHGKTAECVVKVIKPSIKLNKEQVILNVGKTAALKATVTGSSKKVTFQSRNKRVAVVDKNGTITAKKAGTAKIVASANGVKAVCTVTVLPASSRMELAGYLGDDLSSLSYAIGKSLRLDETSWTNPRDYLSGKYYVTQYLPEGEATSFYYTSAYVEFGSEKESSVLNCIEINGYYTTKYSINGIYIRMSMADAEYLLTSQGWHKCTEAEKAAYGIGEPRHSDANGTADERYYTKGGYMMVLSDNNSWNYFDPHNVHNVMYGKISDLTTYYLEDDGHFVIYD